MGQPSTQGGAEDEKRRIFGFGNGIGGGFGDDGGGLRAERARNTASQTYRLCRRPDPHSVG
ncbi:MAG: hypothetical protein PHT51_03320 [Patescibacteria group bacterium]|nr:hypothetical protein [Patescibacteria group bacterium]